MRVEPHFITVLHISISSAATQRSHYGVNQHRPTEAAGERGGGAQPEHHHVVLDLRLVV